MWKACRFDGAWASGVGAADESGRPIPFVVGAVAQGDVEAGLTSAPGFGVRVSLTITRVSIFVAHRGRRVARSVHLEARAGRSIANPDNGEEAVGAAQ